MTTFLKQLLQSKGIRKVEEKGLKLMERNAYFDNARWILMFFVVFGHTIQPFTEENHIIDVTYHWIYTFHMPAFIFVAGFFAKGNLTKEYVLHLMKKLLLPYAAFQVLYTVYYFLIGKEDWLHLPFEPHWALWFLVSLFCWHLLLYWYKRLPKYMALFIAVQLGIIVGYMDPIGHMFSLSRTFVFFPFFLLGYWFSQKEIQWLTQWRVKGIGLIVMATTAFLLVITPNFSIDWFLSSKSYATMEMSEWGGMARLGVYTISAIMMFSVLSWIPSKEYRWSKYGTRTLYVYLLHGLFIHVFREYELFSVNSFLDGAMLAVLSILITWILSSHKVALLSKPLIEMYKYIPVRKRQHTNSYNV